MQLHTSAVVARKGDFPFVVVVVVVVITKKRIKKQIFFFPEYHFHKHEIYARLVIGISIRHE
jgi:hypothetical protein